MTREEAIEVIKDIYNYTKWDTYTTNEARTMAIEALEQEPTTKNDLAVDCISRQEVLNIAKASKSNWIDNSILFKRVNELPSITPQDTRWIPVSERLPKPQANGGDKDLSEWVLVSLSTSKFKSDTVCGAFYCFSEKKWYRERVAFGTVTAWMPSPKPYKAESEA